MTLAQLMIYIFLLWKQIFVLDRSIKIRGPDCGMHFLLLSRIALHQLCLNKQSRGILYHNIILNRFGLFALVMYCIPMCRPIPGDEGLSIILIILIPRFFCFFFHYFLCSAFAYDGDNINVIPCFLKFMKLWNCYEFGSCHLFIFVVVCQAEFPLFTRYVLWLFLLGIHNFISYWWWCHCILNINK